MIAQLQKDQHKHKFSGYRFQPVRIDNIDYDGPFGSYQHWAFIVNVCSCGATKPLEYGRRDEMVKLYGRIKERVSK